MTDVGIREASRILGVPDTTISGWAKSQKVAVTQYQDGAGGKVLVDLESVKDYARNNYTPHRRKNGGGATLQRRQAPTASPATQAGSHRLSCNAGRGRASAPAACGFRFCPSCGSPLAHL